ncbi:hypothetical protein [Flavobacterium cyanobacteriorum]|nr:hypothetical protein [Flavobacterium cyanobacteriorum]
METIKLMMDITLLTLSLDIESIAYTNTYTTAAMHARGTTRLQKLKAQPIVLFIPHVCPTVPSHRIKSKISNVIITILIPFIEVEGLLKSAMTVKAFNFSGTVNNKI